MVNTVKNEVISTSGGHCSLHAWLVRYHNLNTSMEGHATALTVKLLPFPPSNYFYQIPDRKLEGKGAVTLHIVYSSKHYKHNLT